MASIKNLKATCQLIGVLDLLISVGTLSIATFAMASFLSRRDGQKDKDAVLLHF